jgi:hypothetical protein
MYETYGGKIWGEYGFKDAFNLDTNVSLGGCQPWWTDAYIGIDEGAIMLMIENHRSGMVWREFMQNPYVKRAMWDAGFVPTIRGDLNCDCALTPADAAIALQLAVCGECSEIADVSGDGRVTSLDALMILQMAVKDSGAVSGTAINELMPIPIGADR